MRRLITVFFLLVPTALPAAQAAGQADVPNNVPPIPAAPPTVWLRLRTVHKGEFIKYDRIPENPQAAPFKIAPPSAPRTAFALWFDLWTPSSVPLANLAEATGSLRKISDAGNQEWGLEIEPVKLRPPATEATPGVLRAKIYEGLDEKTKSRDGWLKNETLVKWRGEGRLPDDWGSAGTLANTHPFWNTSVLAKPAPHPVGEYRLDTSFAGNLKFRVDPPLVFMPPLNLDIQTIPLDWTKPVRLHWNGVEGAVGYRVRATGVKGHSGDIQTVIVWSSAPLSSLDSEAPVSDPAQAVRDGYLLPQTVTECTIPGGIFEGVGAVTFFVEALGPVKTITETGRPTMREAAFSDVFVTLQTGQLRD